MRWPTIAKTIPGLALALIVAAAAWLLGTIEHEIFGIQLLDRLVIAIVLGTLIHTAIGLAPACKAGVDFSAKFILELAIVLLGATISMATLTEAGNLMIAIVAATVILSLAASYCICRLLGMTDQLATLVACGNSICGNSAIVAAAPVIGAKSDDIAASIAFTAALGIVVVLLLPPLFPLLNLSQWQYGVFAGMTVYAVPQVVAATAPVGIASVQIGTLVKLMRVLMLGPVVLMLRLKRSGAGGEGVAVARLVPWFIIGFFLMMLLRNLDVIPDTAADMTTSASALLTTVAMAALGLSVNMRTVFASGGRVLLGGVLSLVALGLLSFLALAALQAQ